MIAMLCVSWSQPAWEHKVCCVQAASLHCLSSSSDHTVEDDCCPSCTVSKEYCAHLILNHWSFCSPFTSMAKLECLGKAGVRTSPSVQLLFGLFVLHPLASQLSVLRLYSNIHPSKLCRHSLFHILLNTCVKHLSLILSTTQHMHKCMHPQATSLQCPLQSASLSSQDGFASWEWIRTLPANFSPELAIITCDLQSNCQPLGPTHRHNKGGHN